MNHDKKLHRRDSDSDSSNLKQEDGEFSVSGEIVEKDNSRGRRKRKKLNNQRHAKVEINSGAEASIKWSNMKRFLEKHGYEMQQKIAESMAGFISKAQYLKTGATHAIKILPVDKEQYLEDEYNILRSLDHPNVVAIFEQLDTTKDKYVPMQYCSNDLLDVLRAQKFQISEEKCAHIMFQVFQALDYLHSIDIIHRDIKVMNICVISKDKLDDSCVKLIDFGLAIDLKKNKAKLRRCGTPSFMSPEMWLKKPYGSGTDVWSAGCVLYVLMRGKKPFGGSKEKNLGRYICRNKVDFTHPRFQLVSSEGKDLLRKLLAKKSKKRIKTNEICDHPWFEKKSNFLKRDRSDFLEFFETRFIKYFQLPQQEQERRLKLAPHLDCREVEKVSLEFTWMLATQSSQLRARLISEDTIERGILDITMLFDLNEAKFLVLRGDPLEILNKNTKLCFTKFLAVCLTSRILERIQPLVLKKKKKEAPPALMCLETEEIDVPRKLTGVRARCVQSAD